MTKPARRVVTIFAAFLITGCSSVHSLNPFASSQQTSDSTTARIENSQEPNRKGSKLTEPGASSLSHAETTTPLELTWQVPGEAVEKYHIYYGLDPDNLENHLEILVGELKKVDDPRRGPIFQYKLKQVPANRAIYVSIRAENAHGLSEASPVMKLEAGQKSVGR